MGPLATHMIVHIGLMNLVAPLVAVLVIVGFGRSLRASPGVLALATLGQLLALWAWHAPMSLVPSMHSVPLTLAMHLSLFLLAALFWWAVFAFDRERIGRPIIALLITGKLFCLLAALFVFAPRLLYPGLANAHGMAAEPSLAFLLADQQLAGAIMLAACPATYVLAGLILTARWFKGATRRDGTSDENAGPANGMA